MSAPVTEIVTTDIATYSAGRAIAVVQRHDITDTGEVRFDYWTHPGDFQHDGCNDPDAGIDYGTVVVQAGHKLRELQQRGGQR